MLAPIALPIRPVRLLLSRWLPRRRLLLGDTDFHSRVDRRWLGGRQWLDVVAAQAVGIADNGQ